MKMTDWITLVLLGCNTVQDIRKREILLLPTLGAAAGGAVWMLLAGQNNAGVVLLSAMPGILLILLAFVTAGEIGCGDGIALLAAGIWGGVPQILYIAAGGVFLSAAAAGVLLAGRSRIRSIPMVPFFLAAAVIYYIPAILR